jgi:hypothetical protein
MDIGQALGFVFEDEEWAKKILVGALLVLIPIFGQFALMGYGIAVTRNVISGKSHPLPAWDDLGRYFMDGLMFWVVTLVYALPVIVMMCPLMMVWILPAFSADQEGLSNVLVGIAGLASSVLICLALLYGLFMALLTPVLQIRYAETGEIGACLRLGEVFRFLVASIGNIVVSQLVVWIAGTVIMPVAGILTLGLLVLPASVWLTAFSSHLFAQVGRRAGVARVAV